MTEDIKLQWRSAKDRDQHKIVLEMYQLDPYTLKLARKNVFSMYNIIYMYSVRILKSRVFCIVEIMCI